MDSKALTHHRDTGTGRVKSRDMTATGTQGHALIYKRVLLSLPVRLMFSVKTEQTVVNQREPSKREKPGSGAAEERFVCMRPIFENPHNINSNA